MTSPSETPLLSDRRPRPPVNLRSILLGLTGVLFICLITPFNDFVANNTYFTGNFLPIGLVLFFLFVVMALNAPLSRWAPNFAFDGGELAVALGMTLVSCTLPSSGLMRFLPSQLVGVWYHAGSSNDYRTLLDSLHLPDWMYPDFTSTSAADRARDPVVRDFWGRASVEDDTFVGHFRAVPWHAWLRPALAWGILVACLYGAILCMAVLVRRQWVENERLPFPLASMYVSLIESPPRGRAFNRLFCTPSFWVAFGSVFFIHAVNAMHVYQPKYFPEIPLRFNLNLILTEGLLRHVVWFVKSGAVFFAIVGITYLVQAKVAFSIWACMLLWQIPQIAYGEAGRDWSWMGLRDQLFGALIAYALTILWTGRRQWRVIVLQMLGRGRDEQDRGRYLSYPVAGWGFVFCLIAICTWLALAGAGFIAIVMIVSMFLLIMLVLMRIVAETGLIFVHFLLPIYRPWFYLFQVAPSAFRDPAAPRSVFFTTMFESLLGTSQRENLAVYSSHALRTTDALAYDDHSRESQRGKPKGFIFSLVLALVVGYFASGASMLWCEYTYAATIDRSHAAPINSYAMDPSIKQTLDLPLNVMTNHTPPSETHNPLAHIAFGAALTSLLSILYLRFPWWPIHPMGYVLLGSWTIWLTWFSIFLGWLAKVIVLKWGGSQAFYRARPFFIGLIVGECSAAGFWLTIGLIRGACGMDYRAINLLPM